MFKWLQRGLTSFHDNLKLGQQMKAMEGFIDLHPNATEEEKLAEASRIKAESDRRVGPFINPELRAKFDRQEPPEPEKKVQFFNTIAEEVNQVFIKHERHLSELPGGANFNSVFALCGILRSWLANYALQCGGDESKAQDYVKFLQWVVATELEQQITECKERGWIK